MRICTALGAIQIFVVAATLQVNAAVTDVATSSDNRLMLVSGKSTKKVLAAVNEAGAGGFRLVAVTTIPLRDFGVAGVRCLLEKSPDENAPEFRYVFLEVPGGTALTRKIQEHAADGFRIVPWGLLDRPTHYVFIGGVRIFIVMERSSRSPVVEYSVVSAMTRKREMAKVTENCEQGYQFVGIISTGGRLLTFWERIPSTEVAEHIPHCKERYDILNYISPRKFRKQLVERSAQGYRLLAAANYGSMILERTETDGPTYTYRFPFVEKESAEDAIATMNAWTSEGFRLHPLSLWVVMEQRKPGASRKTEYRLVDTLPAREWLDAITDAIGVGFRVTRFCGEGTLLLER